jgi:hypothetical protein
MSKRPFGEGAVTALVGVFTNRKKIWEYLFPTEDTEEWRAKHKEKDFTVSYAAMCNAMKRYNLIRFVDTRGGMNYYVQEVQENPTRRN